MIMMMIILPPLYQAEESFEMRDSSLHLVNALVDKGDGTLATFNYGISRKDIARDS